MEVQSTFNIGNYYYQLFILMKSFQNHISYVSISTFILVVWQISFCD